MRKPRCISKLNIIREQIKNRSNSVDIELVNKKKERILIDFDKVIHSYHEGWLDGSIYGYPIQGSKESIEHLIKIYDIYIFTSRISKEQENYEAQKLMISDWLNKYHIPYTDITSDKLSAVVYIDDRGVRFEGNWLQTMLQLKQILKF